MDLDAAIRSALDHLRGARWHSGWWEDFDTLAGPSRDWVTAYVGAALAESGDDAAYSMAEGAWRLLARHTRPQGGWGYNPSVPPDADSTAWALRLAAALGVDADEPRVAAGNAFVTGHVLPAGGVTTFAADGPIRAFTRVGPSVSFEGWCTAHACVSAVVGGLDLPTTPTVLDYLRRTQRADGSWPAYWWKGNGYATALAVEALAGAGNPEDIPAIDQAARWAVGVLERRTFPRPSSFETAWCARVLLLRHEDNDDAATALEHALTSLVETQRSQGSWPPSAKLRIPPPHVVDPEMWDAWEWNGRGGGSVQVDAGGAFTAATVLGALTRAAAQVSAAVDAGS
jgi:squalene-hopene/tetraprenyl-beta-curcumene cyclase